jgi:hypothetical protein
MSKGLAKEITICGKLIKLGDNLKVRYTSGDKFTGATIEGSVTELWSPESGSNVLQGRLSNGWCFHDNDEIIKHNQ